jgi:hypothetical protein
MPHARRQKQDGHGSHGRDQRRVAGAAELPPSHGGGSQQRAVGCKMFAFCFSSFAFHRTQVGRPRFIVGARSVCARSTLSEVLKSSDYY